MLTINSGQMAILLIYLIKTSQFFNFVFDKSCEVENLVRFLKPALLGI